jgi:hypothetical protein
MRFHFAVTADVTSRATYALTAVVSVAEWPVVLEGVDGRRLDSPSLDLEAQQTGELIVEIDPDTAAGGRQFSLALRATAAGVTGTSGLFLFTVGDDPPEPAPGVTLAPLPVILYSPASFSGETLTVGPDGAAEMDLKVTFATGGRYRVAVAEEAGASGWSPRITAQLPAQVSDGATRVISFGVVPTTGVTPTSGLIRLMITDDAGNTLVTVWFALEVGA